MSRASIIRRILGSKSNFDIMRMQVMFNQRYGNIDPTLGAGKYLE